MAALLGNLSTVKHPSANPELIQYIYCVELPFECWESQQIPSSLDLVHVVRPFRQSLPLPFSLQLPRWAVVKVGISKDPARRLHEIFDVFDKLGLRKQAYLGDIEPTDTPDEAIRKAKTINNIVFIKKVHNIGTAEADIRRWLGYSLGADFINKFTTHKGKSLDRDGMTEWRLVESGFVRDLQSKFRSGELCGRRMPPTPSGDQLFYEIRRHIGNYANGILSPAMYQSQFEDEEEYRLRLLQPQYIVVTIKLADFQCERTVRKV